MFTAIGGLLAGYGALSDRSIYARSLGINVNLLWGSVLFAFGLALFFASRRGMNAPRKDGKP
jgi:hypothetical protein